MIADHAVRQVPFRLEDPAFVSRERYTDAGFAALEHERLWPRVWQMACRLEEIPAPGDFVEYVIGDQSILVVRESDTEVRAFFNACRHRATELAKGAGTFNTGQIVCPFHGWRWRLDGTNAGVYGRNSFRDDLVTPEELCLRACRVETWGGCAFVNLDDDAPPLRDALAPMPDLLDPLGIDRMRVRWWKCVVLRANWKLAQEAFMEGFHVMQTHPQLTLGRPEQSDPDSLEYSVHPNGHSSFQNRSRASGRMPDIDFVLESARLLYTGLDSMTLARDLHVLEGLRRRPIPDGSTFGAEMVKAWYGHMSASGVPVPAPDKDAIARWGGVFFCFPNFFVLPQYANALCYRSRPYGDDPGTCLFELWSVTIPADGEEFPRPELQGPFAPDDTSAWPQIPLQDFSNIERQQRGLHSRSITGMRLSSTYEAGIANMHRELDGYLDG